MPAASKEDHAALVRHLLVNVARVCKIASLERAPPSASSSLRSRCPGWFLAIAARGQIPTAPTEGLHENPPRVHALVNARLVVAPGQVIDHGCLVVRDGLIAEVGSGRDAARRRARVGPGRQNGLRRVHRRLLPLRSCAAGPSRAAPAGKARIIPNSAGANEELGREPVRGIRSSPRNATPPGCSSADAKAGREMACSRLHECARGARTRHFPRQQRPGRSRGWGWQPQPRARRGAASTSRSRTGPIRRTCIPIR